MTKLCPRGKSAAKKKFKVYPSAYANAYASKICAGKIKDPSGVKRKDFKGPKPAGAKKGKAIMIVIGIGKKKKVDKKMGGGMPTAGGMSAMGRLQKARMMNKGGDAKIKKVITGLHKASALHKGQAKSLQSVVKKKSGGSMNEKRDIRKVDSVLGKNENKFKDMRPKRTANVKVDKKMSGGLARGGGAAIRGTKFQGVF